jgi:hypothetical protein
VTTDTLISQEMSIIGTQMGTSPPETLSTESLIASDILTQAKNLLEISSTTVGLIIKKYELLLKFMSVGGNHGDIQCARKSSSNHIAFA